MNTSTFKTLEFDSIRALLLSHAGSALGRARLEGLWPLEEARAVRELLALTGEAVALLREPGRQPYHDLPDLTQTLAGARVEGYAAEPRALLDAASFIEGSLEIARRVARAEGAPRLARRASGVKDATAVATAIRRAVLPSGELSDDASPRLAETRRGLARLKSQLHSVMESYLRSKDADRLLQDKIVTTRNDRYVLLLKAESRGQIPGIIHGSSGSGASLFVEPMPAVELNNDIVSLGDEERREVARILRELTARLGDAADLVEHAAEVMGELDALQAKALLAGDMDAHPPEIVETLDLELNEARHPLLMAGLCERLGIPRRSTREPVPVTLRVGAAAPVLVISGPNTGGKTVALKTAGLLGLMAQCGLHVPAAPGSRLPVFRRLYADIGDEQSIAANLSTFSAHLASIVEMTRGLALPALVLLDEVGAGTDPTEGGALGVAIVEHFRRRGAMVLATTHHGLMKAYAQTSPGVSCASFGYDPQTYEPTYRLTLGAAGRSLALEMAERLGLPADLVADARSRREQKEVQAEALLKRLEEEKAALARDSARLDEERRRLAAQREALARAEREVDVRRRAELEAFRKDLLRRGEEAARRAADAIQQAVARVEAAKRSVASAGTRARTEALGEIRKAQQDALADSGADLAPEAAGAPLVPGSRVRLRDLAVVGQVTALPAQGPVEVAVGGKRLLVDRQALVCLEPGAGSRTATGPARHFSYGESVQRGEGSAAAEINVVGLTVDEALPEVDKVLDAAVLSDRRLVRVIHGFGEGRLRKAVADLLEGHPHVAAFHLAASNEGGGGVTVVELKE